MTAWHVLVEAGAGAATEGDKVTVDALGDGGPPAGVAVVGAVDELHDLAVRRRQFGCTSAPWRSG